MQPAAPTFSLTWRSRHHGRRQRHARLVLGRRQVPRRRRRARAGPACWCVRGPPSSTSAASPRGPGLQWYPPTEELAPRAAGDRGARRAASAYPISVDTMKAEVALGARRRRDDPQRRQRLRFDGEMVAWSPSRAAQWCLMHMKGPAQDDAGRPGVRRCRRRGPALSGGAPRACARPRRARGPDHRRTRPRVRQDRGAQPRPARRSGPLQRAGAAGVAGRLAQALPGRDPRAGPADRVIGTVATTVIGYLAGAHIFRVHDVKPNFEALRVALAVREGITAP